MNDLPVERKSSVAAKERAQYALAFGVVALMLYVAGFPLFFLLFVAVLTFFIWKIFTSESRSETRKIFEFYLSASEVLRDDDRRWYGFEIQECIARGEAILRAMSTAPPLVHFALGALYHKIGEYDSATKYLAPFEENIDERKIIFPTKELRDYVRMLRKIERAPAEAPLTSAAVRSLERARKHRAHFLLEESRALIPDGSHNLHEQENTREISAKRESVIDVALFTDEQDHDTPGDDVRDDAKSSPMFSDATKQPSEKRADLNAQSADRKTISEVLHDIYDTNIG